MFRAITPNIPIPNTPVAAGQYRVLGYIFRVGMTGNLFLVADNCPLLDDAKGIVDNPPHQAWQCYVVDHRNTKVYPGQYST